jgi:hypothetical protein
MHFLPARIVFSAGMPPMSYQAVRMFYRQAMFMPVSLRREDGAPVRATICTWMVADRKEGFGVVR